MGEVVATIKGDGAAAWIVVHAETAGEAERLLSEATGGLLQTAAEVGQLLTATIQGTKTLGKDAAPPAASSSIDWNKVGQGNGNDWMNDPAPMPEWRNGQQPAQPSWQPQGNQQVTGFVGSTHPEGKRCGLCGSVLVGKQPKVKRMWSCPNQKARDDGHTVEWING